VTDPVPNGSELCTHGEELHAHCDKCAGEQPPSKDLLTRLRTGYLCEVEGCKCHAIEARSGCQCAEAADEIDRQQAQIATLKGYIERTALAGYRCAECAARLTAEPCGGCNGTKLVSVRMGDGSMEDRECPFCCSAQPPGASQ
jgi:hypothetical protein